MPKAAQTPKLEIRLLGELEVVLEGRARPLPASKKTRALLGYLVKTARPQRRERLCELLWDGPDDPRAGLRWSLAKLRPVLDAGAAPRIVADREHVAFEPHGAEIDVLATSELKPAALSSVPTDALAEALARFRGPFLEGLELSSCPAFHAWCVGEREQLRGIHVALLTTLVERRRAEPARALGHARELVALDPLAESPRLVLLDLLAALGDVRRALEEYDDYASMLQRELGVKPSFELERRRMALARAPIGGSVASAAPVLQRAAPSLSPGNDQLSAARRFVGRQRERDLLARVLASPAHTAPALIVQGEPGIGKSRLLEELARMTRERGGLALAGRAFEAELVRPYGAFIDALRPGFGPRLDVPSEAAGGEPSRGGELLPSPFAEQAVDRTRLYDAVLALLAHAARQRGLVVLLLDDLHWFDEASAELFHYLARARGDVPLLLAATARGGELADNAAAQRLVRALGRERLCTLIELGPLGPDELVELVGSGADGLALSRALAESGGNPLFALEAARALCAGSSDLVGSLSRLMAERLGRLQEPERALLSWAAALGRSFDVDVLARVTGLGAPELLSALERLERHAVLRSRDTGYDFAHDLLRQAAYRQMSGPRQRLVHAQIARALSAAPDPDGALASDVAHHAALAGDAALSTRACVTAGRRCLRLFATREARDLAIRGARLAASLPDAERVTVSVELLSIRLLAENEPDLHGPLSLLAQEARALGLGAVEARAFFLRSLLSFRAGDSRAAIESTLSRIEATRHGSPLELGAELAGAARCCLLLEKNLDVAGQFVARSQSILGDGAEHLDLFWSQGLLAHVRGDLERASERLSRALLLARREHAYWEECECLLELARIDLERGEHERALAHTVALASVAEKLVESAYAPVAESLRALAEFGRQPAADFGEFERTLPALRTAGANRLLSVVLNRAAHLALGRGHDEHARQYADQALAAAERVERVSEIVTARVTLARVALRARDTERARRELAEASVHRGGPDLSAPSATALESLRELVQGLAPHP